SDPPGGVPTARREPGYILFIALIYMIFSTNAFAVFAVQALLSAATAGLLYGLAARVFSPVAARFAFWACVFYPYFIYYAGYFFREDFLAFLVVLLLYVLVRWTSIAATLFAGVLAGWVCLSNGAWAPGCAWIVLALFVTGKPGMRMKRSAAFALPFLLLIGGWAWRNWTVFHAFIPFSTNVGGEIYLGMTIPYEILGTPEQSRLLEADATFQSIMKLKGEVILHKAFLSAAKDYFLANPLKFLATQAEHAVKIWRFFPHNRSYSHSYVVVALSALGSDGWLIPLGMFGLWVKHRDFWVRWFLLPLLLSVTWSFSLSQSPIRYRVPLMIIVLMLAGAGFEELLRRRKSSA
ncbi:MAG: glycosyltransferase family 39 protein, partial [Elusimicrobiota bacterium]|nr:glycosyltransferase family 39 protein [Elusimicrobiota bacterium]